MTLEEATQLAQKQADEFGVVMIVVKDDLSEDPGGYECCSEMYRDTLYPDHHRAFALPAAPASLFQVERANMMPTFEDLAGTALFGILLCIPFVLLGAMPVAMVVAFAIALATCIYCHFL